MSRLLSLPGVLAALVFGCAASPRKPVDAQAMREAMRSTADSGEHFASSASYAHFLKARLLHHEGEHRRALDELRLALVTDDGSPFLLVTMAEEYARVGDLGRAERALRRVLLAHPDYARAQRLMGRVLSESKKLARARVHLKRAMRLAPQEPDAYYTLAQVELEAQRPDEAIAAMEALARAVPDDPRGLRLLGLVFSERRDLRRAEQTLLRAVEIFPGDHPAWAALAELYETTSRLDQAEAAYAQALSRDGDNLSLLLAAGRVAVQLDHVEQARAWLDRALSLTDEPEMVVRISLAWLLRYHLDEALAVLEKARARPGAEPRLSYYAGLLHEKKRDHARAAEAYGRVPPTSEMYLEAWMRQAAALSLAGEHPRAQESFRRLAQEQPWNPAVYPPWARALERAGALKEAEKLLRSALSRMKVGPLYQGLSLNLQRQGRSREAVTLLEGAVAQLPADPALRLGLAAAYERAGEVERALALMRRVLVESPGDAAALNFVGYLLADGSRDLDEAERLVRRALEQAPDSGAFLDSLGWVLFRKGQTQQAVELLERAHLMEPDEPVILEHLGDAYQQAHRPEDARRVYRQALEVLEGGDEPVDARALRAGLERKLRALSTGSAGR